MSAAFYQCDFLEEGNVKIFVNHGMAKQYGYAIRGKGCGRS